MAEVDNRNFVEVKVHIPAGLYQEVQEWMADSDTLEPDGTVKPIDWEKFIEMAWATVPWIYSAYDVYIAAYQETPELKRTPGVMSLDEFAHHSVYEWFK